MRRRSAAPDPVMRSPNATFSRTVIQGKTPCSWNTNAAGIAYPSSGIVTEPTVRSSRPPRMRRKVDFPQPEGPTMQVKEPGARVREKSSRAQTGSVPEKKTFETSSATTAPGAATGGVLCMRAPGHGRAAASATGRGRTGWIGTGACGAGGAAGPLQWAVSKSGPSISRAGPVASALPAGAEEASQQVTAFLLPHPGDELDAVVQARFAHQVVEGSGGTGLGVHRPDDDALDAGEHDRARAHRARLEGDGEGRAGEVPAPRRPGRRAQGEDLCVGGGVLVGLAAVPCGREH